MAKAWLCTGSEYDGTKVWWPESISANYNNQFAIWHNDGLGTFGASTLTTSNVSDFTDTVIAL